MKDTSTMESLATSRLVAFGICTFRRPILTRTLQSLAQQDPGPGFRCCIIVADNDDQPSAQPVVEQAAADLPFPVHYVHAPSRNISIARNALLEKATALGAEFLAMIDDDEIASPDWARCLLSKITGSGADAVLGPVLALYRPEAPAWLHKARIHDVVPVVLSDGRIHTGYTGNLILRLDSPPVRGRRFDLAFGRTGGEDDVFLSGLVRDGGRIEYAPEAIAREDVPAPREKLSFLMRRSFRSGQTFGRINAPKSLPGRTMMAVKAAAKIVFLALSAAVMALSPSRRNRALMRASLHAGVCSQLFGRKILELYNS
ncbi:MAG: glycosyltransferase family 2 protein [Rhodobacteraceae bacterium]|nr:glycosyltransferase family 2 protein [Paracoccaceae bacterium]